MENEEIRKKEEYFELLKRHITDGLTQQQEHKQIRIKQANCCIEVQMILQDPW